MKRIIFYLVALVIIGILVLLAVPRIYTGPSRPGPSQAINNARQIHLATMSMADDGEKNHQLFLGWPGDLKARGKIHGIEDFVNTLALYDYLKPDDLKLFAAAGIKAYKGKWDASGRLSPGFANANSAFKVYLVRDSDPPDTLFMATKNFTYGKPLDPKAAPFGDKGFVVVRKGGNVSIFKKQQVHNLQLIGQLPGGGTVETPENCLNP